MSPDDRIARAIGALDRLPRIAHRALIAAIPLLLLAGLVATFAIAPSGRGGDTSVPGPAARHRATANRLLPAPRPAPAAATGEPSLSAATGPALRFLHGYLASSYGRGRVQAIRAASRELIAALRRGRPRVPPAARTRRPRIASLQVLSQAPGTAQATATISDGSGVEYPLVFHLDRRASGWTVTRLADD
jgi:hypothetical protein